MQASNAKALAALALTGLGTALVAGFRVPSTDATVPASTGTAAAAASAGPAASSGSSTTGSAASSPSASTAASAGAATTTVAYANGTYTGSAVSEPWGTFQVQAVINGGKLTNVVVVSEPQDGHSTRINSQAVPTRTQSAIAAQSASIDAVSGATWTSQSYMTSLQAALDQAKTAVVTVG